MSRSNAEDHHVPAIATHDHSLRVVYRDTDQMGVVYYANYFVYMEIARVELLRARGTTYRAMEEAGFRIPVLHAECDYRRPLFYDDEVRIRTMLTELTRARLGFRYELWCDARSELVATGATRHTFLDVDNRPRRLDAEFLQKLSG